jgi:hypothetical protein
VLYNSLFLVKKYIPRYYIPVSRYIYGNINIWNIRTRITLERTLSDQFGAKFKLVFCAKYDRRFTLVLIKINYGQIGDQTGLFYTTDPVFYTSGNIFVRRTGTFGNLWFFHLSRRTTVIQDILIKTKVKRQIKTLLLYHLLFLHALMMFKDIDKIKVAISETL